MLRTVLYGVTGKGAICFTLVSAHSCFGICPHCDLARLWQDNESVKFAVFPKAIDAVRKLGDKVRIKPVAQIHIGQIHQHGADFAYRVRGLKVELACSCLQLGLASASGAGALCAPVR